MITEPAIRPVWALYASGFNSCQFKVPKRIAATLLVYSFCVSLTICHIFMTGVALDTVSQPGHCLYVATSIPDQICLPDIKLDWCKYSKYTSVYFFRLFQSNEFSKNELTDSAVLKDTKNCSVYNQVTECDNYWLCLVYAAALFSCICISMKSVPLKMQIWPGGILKKIISVVTLFMSHIVLVDSTELASVLCA